MNGSSRPLLIIGLDGLEISYANRLMDRGELPTLAALRERSENYQLEHGAAQRTGLAWEHVASGLSPKDMNRWSAVEFNPETYEVWQQPTLGLPPFLASLDAKSVVFDAPYFDLSSAPNVRGIVGWGAHDPGVELTAQPSTLLAEFHQKFGPHYPASTWTYACPCYSAQRCQSMGKDLKQSIEVRAEATKWLFQKFPDSDCYFVVTGELHSAIEALWHGIDPTHPLHHHPSASSAASALNQVHKAVDALIANLMRAMPEANVLVFAMGGMGINNSDLQSMVLLPELLYRNAFGRSLLRLPRRWTAHPEKIPELTSTLSWGSASQTWFPRSQIFKSKLKSSLNSLQARFKSPPQLSGNLWWHVAEKYQSWWSQMPAFALPSFYDGRIRVNLQGRERNGTVALEDYDSTCKQIEALVRSCQDPRTGSSIVAHVERPSLSHPFELHSSDADLTIVWAGPSNALVHSQHGYIGPLPYRRTGGHTGPHGVAFIDAGHHSAQLDGVHTAKTYSSFDVVPTIADLLGQPVPVRVSGKSLLHSEVT